MIPRFFAGVDVGASATKTVVMDSSLSLAGHSAVKSGTDFPMAAGKTLEESCAMAGIKKEDLSAVFATGYGRKTVKEAVNTKTEISCHAKGCFHNFPGRITIIDIGGQDNKIIKLAANGSRTGFQMNRKCAAGTGAFLEEMSARLDIPIEKMNRMASEAAGLVKLGSFCTVFSATEVLENIRAGKQPADIVKGIYFSMIKRVLEMDSLAGDVVMTGGVVAHNGYIVKMAERMIGRKILVPDLPQFTGALGAALFAKESM
ncbi:MAG: acyl-CoA dehydratase activase [Desulfobacteraceae bacterium]